LVVLELVNWILSGYCYKYIADLYILLGKYGYQIALGLVMAVVLVSGYLDNTLMLTGLTMTLFTSIGMLIKDVPTKMCLVFALFVSPDLMPEIYRFYLVHMT
jgi:hypothetical protein